MIVSELRGPNVEQVLTEYGDVLRELRQHVPDLILVGGAVRDVYFRRPVKDLDYMSGDGQAPRVIAEHYNESIYPCLRRVTGEEYDGARDTMIAAYENEGKTVNVLWVSGIEARIAHFPDSISQVWTDGEKVYASGAFQETAASRIVTYNERMTDERLDRIKTKYPDFEYVYKEPA